MNTVEQKKVAPDGGYGWIIVLAFALYFTAISAPFGLMFRDKIIELQLTATDVAVIQNYGSVIGWTLSLFGGVLIKRCGCRTAAFVSCLFAAPGILWSAHVRSYTQFIMSYTILQSVGTTIGCMTVLNAMISYFDKNRSKASGVSMTLIAISPIVIPPIIELLQRTYDSDGCLLILAGFSMHIFVASALLQPIEWHRKPAPIECDTELATISENKLDKLNESENEYPAADEVTLPPAPSTETKRPIMNQIISWMVDNFDLRLLQSGKFIISILAVSLTDFSEINFTFIIPYILDDLKYTTAQVAWLMSVIGIADIVTRLLSPFVGDFFKQNPKHMFMYSGIIFIFMRLAIQQSSTYIVTMVACVLLGMGKGVFFTYWNLVMPNIVPIERLPSAIAFLLISNSVFLGVVGPLVGAIRDYTGSYSVSIILLNLATFLSLALWTVEMIWIRFKARSKKPARTL